MPKSRGSVVGEVLCYGLGDRKRTVRFSAESKTEFLLILQRVRPGSVTYLSLYTLDSRRSLLGKKLAEAWSCPFATPGSEDMHERGIT